MHFELSDALISSILFSMEDQNGSFYVDARENTVVDAGSGDYPDIGDPGNAGDASRYFPVPQWDSSDGYRLMERFASTFRNPLIRHELIAALEKGRGVFRAFKDVLNRHPGAEKLWFSFKEREMKREILRWYNGLREEWGLERIGEEPEETLDLISEDFKIREGREEDRKAAEELHRICADEYREYLRSQGDREAEEILLHHWNSGWAFPGDRALAAETAGGEFAGYTSAVSENGGFRIAALQVHPEYRGLGLGKSLLCRLLESFHGGNGAYIGIELPENISGFARVLSREAFKPLKSTYYINPAKLLRK